MNLLLKKFALLSTAIFLASTVFNDNVQAQRKSGGVSLAELGCQRFAGLTDVNRDFSGGYTAVNQDVVIGGQLLRSFAVLGNIRQYGWQGIFREDPGPEKVACRLAPVNGSSEFRSLILQFGLSDSSRLSDGSVALRLKVSLDGEYYGEKLITRGDLIRWAIPVSGIRSVTLEGHCIRPKVYEQTCPNIWFTQDLLTR